MGGNLLNMRHTTVKPNNIPQQKVTVWEKGKEDLWMFQQSLLRSGGEIIETIPERESGKIVKATIIYKTI